MMVNKLINIVSLFAVLLAVFAFVNLPSEKLSKTSLYKVIKVNGRILFIKSGESLKTGDSYLEGTALSFASIRDRAAIVNKIKGRYILQPNSKGKAIVLPATSNIEPRGTGSVLLNMLDVKNYFSDSCVFIGDVKVTLGKEAFPLNKTQFFYVTYMYKNEKIAKKIPFEKQDLKVSEQDLFEIDGKAIPTFRTEMTLYYMKGDNANKIGVFTPLFPSQELMKKEIEVLLDGLESLSDDKKIDEVATYVAEFYGKPQKENLNDWLFKTFNLGIQDDINFK